MESRRINLIAANIYGTESSYNKSFACLSAEYYINGKRGGHCKFYTKDFSFRFFLAYL